MENKCTGFVEEISKIKTEKEILHDYLELPIDRPFHTNITKEIPKSLFDSFFRRGLKFLKLSSLFS